jgi:four helix bundle protein
VKVEDLKVYRKLFTLSLKVHTLTLIFPKFEIHELGSQMRRSSNSAPANLAEGFDNKHTNIYLESISRAQGEIRETVHHLNIASQKNYLLELELKKFLSEYEECSKMLYGLEKSLNRNSKK